MPKQARLALAAFAFCTFAAIMLCMAIGHPRRTFVYISAGRAVPFVARLAITEKTTGIIGTGGVDIAGGRLGPGVHIHEVHQRRVRRAALGELGTPTVTTTAQGFLHEKGLTPGVIDGPDDPRHIIGTGHILCREHKARTAALSEAPGHMTIGATPSEDRRPRGVREQFNGRHGVCTLTLVHIGAASTIAREAGLTHADEAPIDVITIGVGITVVGVRGTFVHISAGRAVAGITGVALTSPCIAGGIGMAIHRTGVVVDAGVAIPGVSSIAATFEAASRVDASGVAIAPRSTRGAFIDIRAGAAITGVSAITGA